MKITSVFLLIVISAISSCASGPEHQLSGLYLNEDTGGYVVFKETGEFFYAFEPANREQYKTGTIPRNRGAYSIVADGHMALTTRSAHYGLFEFKISETEDTLLVTRIKDLNSRQKVTEVFKKHSLEASPEQHRK